MQQKQKISDKIVFLYSLLPKSASRCSNLVWYNDNGKLDKYIHITANQPVTNDSVVVIVPQPQNCGDGMSTV